MFPIDDPPKRRETSSDDFDLWDHRRYKPKPTGAAAAAAGGSRSTQPGAINPFSMGTRGKPRDPRLAKPSSSRAEKAEKAPTALMNKNQNAPKPDGDHQQQQQQQQGTVRRRQTQKQPLSASDPAPRTAPAAVDNAAATAKAKPAPTSSKERFAGLRAWFGALHSAAPKQPASAKADGASTLSRASFDSGEAKKEEEDEG
jgi:hypothetical protein